MSDVIGWTIIAIIAAVVLSWGVSAGRARATGGTVRIDSFLRRQPVLLGLMAIALAGLSQYVLQQDQPMFAAIGYGFAVLLFVGALRPWMPVTVLVDPSSLSAGSSTKSTPSQSGPARPRSAFLQTWRYYTLDNLLTGRPPVIPNSAAGEPPLDPARALTNSVATATTVEIFAAAQPAAVRIWRGFDRPQSLCVTARGNVFVLDGGRQCVYCLNPMGQIIRSWFLPGIPELQSCHVAVSPDGQQLYLTDPARGQVYSVTLREDPL
jgi:hypothetical protein